MPLGQGAWRNSPDDRARRRGASRCASCRIRTTKSARRARKVPGCQLCAISTNTHPSGALPVDGSGRVMAQKKAEPEADHRPKWHCPPRSASRPNRPSKVGPLPSQFWQDTKNDSPRRHLLALLYTFSWRDRDGTRSAARARRSRRSLKRAFGC